MPHGCRFTMKSAAARSCHVWTYVLVAVVVFQVIGFTFARPYGSGQQTIRLCSKSLSDALFLICQGRGYNSPFSYSGEDEIRTTNSAGPGLVDECCLQACSINQLELYCKPASDETNSQDGMDDSVRIINLPDFLVPKEPDQITRRTLKRKDRTRNKMRKRKHHKKQQGWLAKSDSKDEGRKCGSHCNRRRHRKKSHRGKIQDKIVIPKVPKFKVGTTSPEPSNRINMFPVKTYYGLERSPHAFGHADALKMWQLPLWKVPLDPSFLATLDDTK